MSARKTKLRDSCDACGAAKIKCDRRQPSCGRCLQKGSSCVYGICRRTGKLAAAAKNISNETNTADDAIMSEDGWSLDDAMAIPLGLDLLPSPPNESSSSGRATNAEGPCSIPQSIPSTIQDADLFASFLQQQPYMSLASTDFMRRPPSSPNTEGLTELSSMSNQKDEYYSMISRQLPLQNNENFGDFGPGAEVFDFQDDKHQKCTEEAYIVLGDLMFARQKEEPSQGSEHSTTKLHDRPLDLILQVNRKATARLRILSACPCIRAPGLAVVYALAISRILETYQRTADTIFRLSLPVNQPGHLGPRSVSTPSLSTLSGSSHTLCEDMSDHDSEMTVTEDDGSAGRISIGSFVVDDDQARVALSLQLLSIEVQRVKSLTSLFMYNGNTSQTKMPLTETCDDLEQNLRLWIRREYIRTANLVKSRSMSLCL